MTSNIVQFATRDNDEEREQEKRTPTNNPRRFYLLLCNAEQEASVTLVGLAFLPRSQGVVCETDDHRATNPAHSENLASDVSAWSVSLVVSPLEASILARCKAVAPQALSHS